MRSVGGVLAQRVTHWVSVTSLALAASACATTGSNDEPPMGPSQNNTTGASAAPSGAQTSGAPPSPAYTGESAAPNASPSADTSSPAEPEAASSPPDESGGAATVGIANPASENCVKQGGKLQIERRPDGEVGICVFPDGSRCEEWALFRGTCKRGQSKD